MSLAAMFFLAALCLLAGVLPGLFMDALAPAVHGLVADRMPAQSGIEMARITYARLLPTTAERVVAFWKARH